MISLKDLQNRVYSGKNCTRFEYEFKVDDQGKTVRAVFERLAEYTGTWKMRIILDRTRDKDSDVYNFTYTLPREDVKLELVAAIGLRYFQLYIKEEVQMKSNMDFALGELIEGVVG